MKIIRKAGDTSNILQVFIQDSSSTTGAGLTGLVFNSGSLTAYYHKDTDTTATAITLVTMTVGTFTSSGFKEIDATNMPGWYQFCPPDAAFSTSGSPKTVGLHLKGATNMAPLAIECQLIAADLQDTVRLGLTAMPNVASGSAGAILTSGTGTAQLSVSSGLVTLAASQPGVTIPTVTTVTNQLTASAIATGVWQDATAGDFTAANSVGKSLMNGVALGTGLTVNDITTKTGYSLSGSQTFNVTGNITGNLSGSVGSVTGAVGSVTGAVGSVTGAVGSVTGNVGGNVTGTVGSVVGAVGSVASGGISRASFAADTGMQSVRSNTAQAGASTTITLDASASATNSFYNNGLCYITGGTGVGQARFITGYVGATKVATVNSAWATNPDSSSTFAIIAFDAIPGATAPTAAQVATAVWQDTTAGDFTVASSIGKSLYTSGNAPGAASGLALVGSNMGTITGALTGAQIATAVWTDTTAGDFTTALSVGKSIMNGVSLGTGLTVNDITTKTGYSLSGTQTFNVTGNITGNLSGSVGSVTGAVGSVTGSVGSVTGAVGSVTGNVGGNVVGSVASVTGAVGSVTGNVGGNVVGSVASVTARVTANTDQVSGNATAASNVAHSMQAITRGTCSGGTLTTAVVSTLTSPSSLGATGQLIGRTILFDANTVTTNLQGQASNITNSTTGSTPTLTFTALTTAPVSGDTFSVL